MSEVKVNKISPKQTCTTVTLGDSGDDFVVATGVNFKTAAVKDAAGNVIVSRCGSNITIGSSGAAIALACGATQTGFGRTGTVDWDTTAKTANFTAVSGNGYFVNTTSGAITVTLPAGSAGDIISLADYAATWQTNNVTVTPNGADKIGGVNTSVTLNTEGQSVTFVYTDSTQGWINTMDSTSNVRGSTFISATGGTITTCGDYKIHTFTGPGTFTVASAGTPAGSTTVDYLVIAGGGGGGKFDVNNASGGGGAGGWRASSGTASGCYTAGPAPLVGCVSALPVSATAYPITVGAGGAARTSCNGGNAGSNSIFSTITSAGGGTGWQSGSGGSGGGGQPTSPSGGAGNTPPVSPPQGNPGGGSPSTSVPFSERSSGGGGGAGGNGGGGTNGTGGTGGAGVASSISGSPVTKAAGGAGSPGSGGGSGSSASANTGSGGGGAGGSGPTSGAGGSGIVIIRYKYQ